MKTFLILVLVAAAWAAGYGYGRWYARKDAPAAAPGARRILYYIDPMHPAYKSDKPGTAPDCGMKLEPVYAETPAAPAAERRILHYRDPKDPKYTAGKPGLNPETGNDLEPVYADDPAAMPAGTVRITPEKQQLIGVRYGTVEFTSEARAIRAAGKVALDETRASRVHSKVDGWIDTVFVDFTGQAVKKGQPLLTLYSPELLATQQEYLLALKSKDLMRHSTMEAAADYGDSMLRAARRRLELWDLSEAQIEELARRQEPVKTVTLYAPVEGVVLARNAFPNQRITPETELYALADLGRVWVVADVFEYEAPQVRMGQAAAVTLASLAGRRLHGRVSYIQPQVDPMTRTVKVRLELDNPGGLLKPDMFADVEFHSGAERRLSAPVEAVLDSGRVKTVFVDRGDGHLEPRTVETGQRMGDRVEILSGLKPGERIVVSGTFLVDSESRLKAAAAGMTHPH